MTIPIKTYVFALRGTPAKAALPLLAGSLTFL
jgi:hypothetical protein